MCLEPLPANLFYIANFSPMEATSSEAQVTQSGQAIAINNITCSQLNELFSPMFGPNGSIKALVSGGLQLNLTKDGNALCRDIQFTHPTSILITRAASSLYNSVGDGCISFILLCTEVFTQAYKMYCDGASIPLIINSLQLALTDMNNFLQSNLVPLSDETLRGLAFSSLSTKIKNPEFLVDIVIKALVSLSSSPAFDVNMIEVIKMEEGDIFDSEFIDGLVLDHGGRHHSMPESLENVCVLVTNMSMEYEKPEINAEFFYSSPEQREQLYKTERDFILQKTRKIVDFAEELKKQGKSLVVINEKGIDQYSQELLGEAGILALRRAKRRNLERLVNMCGGKIVTQTTQLTTECLGYCRKVTVKTINENKYTFIEGTPLKGACTILIRGDVDYERLNRSIRGTLHSLAIAVQSKYCIYGGISLYKNIAKTLEEKIPQLHESDVCGYQVLISAFKGLIKTLLKNEGKNVNEAMISVFRDEYENQKVVENVKVVGSAFGNAIVTAINLLMCDEIILAGKPVKQDSTADQQ